MMKIISLLVLSFIPFLLGCDAVVSPDQFDYQPRIVVNGLLTNGEPVDSIRFCRTLPLNSADPELKQGLDDVAAYIETRSGNYPLTSIGNGYYSARDLEPVPGENYRLVAEWEGKRVTATTLVPDKPYVEQTTADFLRAENGDVDSAIYVISAVIRPNGHEVYMLGSAAYILRQPFGQLVYRDDFPNWIPVQGNDDKRNIITQFLFNRPNNNFIPALCDVYAFDEAYADYWHSTHVGEDNGTMELKDKYFPSVAETIRWNVQGDGIGMFIGRSISRVHVLL